MNLQGIMLSTKKGNSKRLSTTCFYFCNIIEITFWKGRLDQWWPGVSDRDTVGSGGQQALTLSRVEWRLWRVLLLSNGQGQSKLSFLLQIRCSSLGQPTGKPWLPEHFLSLLFALKKLSEVCKFFPMVRVILGLTQVPGGKNIYGSVVLQSVNWPLL